MKKTILFLFTLGFLTSCSYNNDDIPVSSEIVGKQKLVEQLSDPGDGSGTFKSVVSDKTIEFLVNGTIISNGTLCYMSTSIGQESLGKYYSSENYIKPDDCNVANFNFFFMNQKILTYC